MAAAVAEKPVVASYAEIAALLKHLTPEEQAQVDEILAAELPKWTPLEGPQRQALECQADVLFYGGSAGGGKTDLLVGLCLEHHDHSIIFRREGTQLQGIIDRMAQIMGSRDGYNGQERIWRLKNSRQVEFGACKDPGDEIRYQGRPHDLKGFDEITHFAESQFRFLKGWKRTTKAGQRQRVVCTGNPPTDSDGEWVIRYWAAWLDPQHPNPAKPGELRWYAMLDGIETEVESGTPFEHKGEIITPESRTFIPSSVDDNPLLLETGYKATLQALPEPLRSQMLQGSFTAGKGSDPWQVIPTAWIEEAMARWSPTGRTGQMDSVGVDVARGGKDKTVISSRYGTWYAPLKKFPGAETPDGAITAGLVISETKDAAPIHVDVIGVGGSVVDHLKGNDIHVISINGADSADEGAVDRATGKLRFRNKRAQLYWKFREMLEPRHGENIALPPDPQLKADLCAPRWKLTPSGIQIESKEDIEKRIGRSTDDGDAVVYCSVNTPKIKMKVGREWRKKVKKGSWRV